MNASEVSKLKVKIENLTTEERVILIQEYLEDLIPKLDQVIKNNKYPTFMSFRVAALNKNKKALELISNLQELISTELITFERETIENIIPFKNYYEDRSNNDLLIIIQKLEKIKQALAE